MRLVYTATGQPVAVGDSVAISGVPVEVIYFRPPHKPSSEGHVLVAYGPQVCDSREFYVSVIGAEWIEREDRA